uniref:Uncharacterized protein n=1 Tax=Populus trichocarpa TaxID=3694 RepID=A0A2K1ZN96_POPTR
MMMASKGDRKLRRSSRNSQLSHTILSWRCSNLLKSLFYKSVNAACLLFYVPFY